MDWMKETITFGGGLVIGVMSGFVWPLLRDKISEKKDRVAKTKSKAQILRHLDLIAADVIASVRANPHGIQNKDKWVSRLQGLATQFNDVLGPMAGYVNRISYKIEDSTFDHTTNGKSNYCCDEVEEDLAFLKLCILPIVSKELGWDSGTIEKEEKQLLRTICLNFAGAIPSERLTQQVEQWYAEWTTYQFRIHAENLAMAPYVNHERQMVDRK